MNSNQEYELVFRQTFPHFFVPNQWTVGTPESDMFSALDDLEKYRQPQGYFQFKLQYTDSLQWWRQTSNFVESPVYSAVNVAHTDNEWRGLHVSDS